MRLWALVPFLLLGGCTSPPASLRESSAETLRLYATLDESYGVLADALALELVRWDRHAWTVDVLLAPESRRATIYSQTLNPEEAAQTYLDGRLPLFGNHDGLSDDVLRALDAVRKAFGLARLHYAPIDRFLRIDVLDLGDVEDLAQQAAALTGELGELVREPDDGEEGR